MSYFKTEFTKFNNPLSHLAHIHILFFLKNKVINVCGTVVGTRYSKKGHAWLNLDKKFPNQVFSIMIRKEELVNYPFDPVGEYADQELCFEGKVEKWGDLIVMQVKKPELISKL